MLGLVHTPVTPFSRERGIDFGTFEKLLAFHMRHGADALALPMHAGESVSLTDGEKRAVVEFAIKQAKGKIPVVAHVSEAGTGIAAALAAHAQAAGAAAVVATTPYYWTPPAAMVLEHFFQIGSAVKIPFFVYNAPEEMPGTRITADLCLKLLDRLPNFAGVVDLSLDWQFMIELMTFAPKKRPGFQLLAGTELMVSAAAVGATGLFSPLAGVAPRLARTLYDACRNDKLFEARLAQEDIGALRQLFKTNEAARLKTALRVMGRECGVPRPPLQALDAATDARFAADLAGLTFLRDEPTGW